MKIYVYILISCLLGTLLLADNSFASICDEKESLIFFGNGIKTLEKKAYDSQNIIKDQLEKYLPPEEFELLGFDIAYNGTHTLPLDLLESSVQVMSGNIRGFWYFFWRLAPVPDWFSEKFILLSSVLDYSTLVTTDSLKDHVTKYKAAISEGKKIVLVAHSQGNLFGNQAYNLLTPGEQSSFGMVSVANVDNHVLGNTNEGAPYTSLTDDKVISALIALQLNLPTSPMSPNTENLTASGDPWGHLFIGSYMADGSVSKMQITEDILTTLTNLPEPYQLVEPGIITVSLTWGPAKDIDLHAYEPNGMHVYWMNMQGLSGTLDRDDRSYNGPEHYHVPSCETLETGIYEIALDYFEGTSPDVATLHIDAGLLSRTYEVAMDSEYYGTSSHPERVANIWVKGDGQGGYSFEIFQ
jgi:hypothetical protein